MGIGIAFVCPKKALVDGTLEAKPCLNSCRAKANRVLRLKIQQMLHGSYHLKLLRDEIGMAQFLV